MSTPLAIVIVVWHNYQPMLAIEYKLVVETKNQPPIMMQCFAKLEPVDFSAEGTIYTGLYRGGHFNGKSMRLSIIACFRKGSA